MDGPTRLLPAFAVFLFLFHLGWVLVDPDKPLCDPGTGWHVKLGQLMVEAGKIPDTDPISYTLPGRQWIDYQWLSHALMGLLHRAGGLPLVTAGWAVLFGLIPVIMARRLMSEGVPVPASWLMAFLAYLILSMHAQVRPHVMTYLCLLVQMGLLARGGRARWFLPALFVLWTNGHAGFVAGLMVLACYAFGECLGQAWETRKVPWSALKNWVLLGLACGLATGINPWGFQLHRHILDHLGMRMLARMDEYQPVWRHPGANVGLFYALAAGWIATVAARVRGLRWGEIMAGVVLLGFAIGSVRHVNLFVIAALPVAGAGVRGVWGRWCPAGVPGTNWPFAGQLRMLPTWGYVFLLGVGFSVLSLAVPGLFRRDFRGLQVGEGALEVIKGLPPAERIFHPESLGGVLAYTFGPERKIFVDDRLDYYGDTFLLGTYLVLMDGGDNWRELLAAHGVGTAVVRRNSGLDRVMAASSDWEMRWSDAGHAIYRRRQP